MRVRVATYNVLHGQQVLGGTTVGGAAGGTTVGGAAGGGAAGGGAVGGGPVRPDDGPLRAAVAALDVDVLGLQEVDSDQPRSGHHHQVRSVAAAMGAAHWYFAPSVLGTPGAGPIRWQRAGAEHRHGAGGSTTNGCATGDGGTGDGATRDGEAASLGGRPLYGVGLVSRLPVLQWRTTIFEPAPFGLPLLVHAGTRPRLLLVPDEPRAAIAAVVAGPRGAVTVATVHLSFVPGYNVRQLRLLRRWLADLPRPLFVVGDLNLPAGVPARITGWQALARGVTYPVTAPRVQLDHVLADGLSSAQVATARCQVHPLPVSDHCAVTVEVEL